MRRLEIATVITFFGLFAVACGGTPAAPVDAGEDSSQGADLATVVDTPVNGDAPAPIDNGVLEAGGLDIPAAVDTPLDTPSSCTSDAACASSTLGPVCDTATGRCVPCTPTTDRCPAGQYCIAGMNRCASGCRDDTGCAGSTPRCNPSTHACVTCVDNGGCSLGATCVGNECVSACSASRPCPAGQGCCVAACADTQSSTENCGGCGMRCVAPNATPVCRSGVCGVGSCTAPFANCDGNTTNGCETDTRTSATHCGACGTACAARANSAASCDAGTCRYSCTSGFGDCDGNATNGCETDTRATPAHCGMCGRACSLPNATAGCALGACTVASCAVGFGNCNGNVADGCEVDTRTSVANCGNCGNACTFTNANATCVAGSCTLGSCRSDFASCDSNAANGCETWLLSTASCGACGTTCPTGGPHTVNVCQISSGTSPPRCALVCEPSWLDCDSNLTNGCEATGSCLVDRELFYDGFEAGGGRWSLGSVWHAEPSSFFSACVGSQHLIAYRTISDPVEGSAYATLITPIDISRARTLMLTHTTRSDSNSSTRFSVGVSTDGGSTWTQFASQSIASCGLSSVDLSSFTGRSTMLLRFSFQWSIADSYDWRVDEVRLRGLVRNY